MYDYSILTTSSRIYKSVGSFGHGAYRILTEELSNRLGKEFADFFAEPVSSENQDETDWRCALKGDPIRLNELTGDEFQIAREKYDDIRSKILELAEGLLQSNLKEDRRLGDAIKNALQIPDENFIYVIKNNECGEIKPVLVNWAHEIDDIPPIPDTVIEVNRSSHKHSEFPEPENYKKTTNSDSNNPEKSRVSYSSVKQQESNIIYSNRKSPWLWASIALTLVLLMLILLIIWLLIEPCGLRLGEKFDFCPKVSDMRSESENRRQQLQNSIFLLQRELFAKNNQCFASRLEASKNGSAGVNNGNNQIYVAPDKSVQPSTAIVVPEDSREPSNIIVLPEDNDGSSSNTDLPDDNSQPSNKETKPESSNQSENSDDAPKESGQNSDANVPESSSQSGNSDDTQEESGEIPDTNDSENSNQLGNSDETQKEISEIPDKKDSEISMLPKRKPTDLNGNANQPNNATTPKDNEQLPQTLVVPDATDRIDPDEDKEKDERLKREKGTVGELNVTLIWHTTSDLDLLIICPSGDEISYRNAGQFISGCNGKLEIDANAKHDVLTNEPVEHIYFSLPSVGDYRAQVSMFKNADTNKPVDFSVIIEHQGDTKILRNTLTENNSMWEHKFKIESQN